MSKEQSKVVVQVYTHLLKKEARRWDGLDNYMIYLEYLDDNQLHREVDTIYSYHKNAKLKCPEEHPREHCLVPLLMEAVGAITDLYQETSNLHEKNRYVLCYYLAMNQCGMIVIEDQ